MIYTYPFNVIQWVKLVLLAGVMSTCLGGVFVGIRWRYWDTKWQQDHSYGQENVNDRLGFHHVMMSVGLWPILLSTCLGGVFVGIRWRYWDTKWQQDHSYGQENVND